MDQSDDSQRISPDEDILLHENGDLSTEIDEEEKYWIETRAELNPAREQGSLPQLPHQQGSRERRSPRTALSRTPSEHGTIEDFLSQDMIQRRGSGGDARAARVHRQTNRMNHEPDGITQALVQLLKSQAVPKLEPFSGEKGEKWKEFVESFLVRYPRSSWNDTQLKPLLKDLLSGNAKAHYATLSEQDRGGSFDGLVEAMRVRLQGTEKVARLKAVERLRTLEMHQGQTVAQFCLELEKLSSRAEPGRSAESLSFMRAEMLYKQLADWDGSFHLAQLMETAETDTVYDKMKDMALTLERTKMSMRSGGGSNEAGSVQKTGWVDPAGKPVCFHCGKPGHVKKDCRKLQQTSNAGGWRQEQQPQQQYVMENPYQGYVVGTPAQQQPGFMANGQAQQTTPRSFEMRIVDEYRNNHHVLRGSGGIIKASPPV